MEVEDLLCLEITEYDGKQESFFAKVDPKETNREQDNLTAVSKSSRPVRRSTKPNYLRYNFSLTSDEPSKTFKCSVCKKLLSTKETLRKHILSKHIKLKPFRCDFCDKSFVFEKALLSHIEIHSESPKYHCICGKNFKVESSYLDHIRRLHQAVSETPFPCSLCDKAFYDRHTMRIHIKSVHEAKTIKCSHVTCLKVFSTISLMHAHYRSHEINKYICPECKKSFKTKSYLQKHRLTHNGIRPYKCRNCSNSYLSISHLNQHARRAHTSSATYECTVCGKCFKTKEQKTYHLNAHKGEKPFVCDICGYKTSFRNNLCSHKKRMHRKEEKKDEVNGNQVHDKFNNKSELNKKTSRKLILKTLGTSANERALLSTSLDNSTSNRAQHPIVNKNLSIKKVKKEKCSDKKNDLKDNTELLNVGESFLEVPASVLWEESVEQYNSPDLELSNDITTYKEKTSSQISIKNKSQILPNKKRIDKNVTLNYAVSNYIDKVDDSFIYDY